MRVFPDGGKDGFIRRIHGDGDDLFPGCEHILHEGIGKLQRALHEFRLFLIDRAFRGDGLDDVVQLVLRDSGFFLLLFERLADPRAELGKHERNGREYFHQRNQGTGYRKRKPFVARFCEALRDHFRHKEHHDRRHDRGYRYCFQAPKLRRHERCNARAANMHDVVADQERGERLIEMIQNIEHPRCPPVPVVRIAHHADAVHRGKRDLSSCKIRATKDQKNDGYEISYRTSVLHCGDQLLLSLIVLLII